MLREGREASGENNQGADSIRDILVLVGVAVGAFVANTLGVNVPWGSLLKTAAALAIAYRGSHVLGDLISAAIEFLPVAIQEWIPQCLRYGTGAMAQIKVMEEMESAMIHANLKSSSQLQDFIATYNRLKKEVEKMDGPARSFGISLLQRAYKMRVS